jgi:hypothetical protein
MQRTLSFARPLFFVAGAVAMLLTLDRYWPVRLASSIFLCGYAIRWASVDRAWLPLRHRFGVSEITGVRIAMMFYAAAGVPGVVGAVLYLPPAGAAIFCVFPLAWSAGCIWVLRRIPNASPAGQIASQVHKAGQP